MFKGQLIRLKHVGALVCYNLKRHKIIKTFQLIDISVNNKKIIKKLIFEELLRI